VEIYDIHFKNLNKTTVQLTLGPHETDKREREEDVVGTIMGEGLPNAKLRLLKLLESQLDK